MTIKKMFKLYLFLLTMAMWVMSGGVALYLLGFDLNEPMTGVSSGIILGSMLLLAPLLLHTWEKIDV